MLLVATLHDLVPSDDVSRVCNDDRAAYPEFHGNLVLFLDGIAGYSSWADRLNRKTRAELRAIKEALAQSFFEQHPEFEHCRARITYEETPNLFEEMRAAEENRIDLLSEVERLLKSGQYGPMIVETD